MTVVPAARAEGEGQRGSCPGAGQARPPGEDALPPSLGTRTPCARACARPFDSLLRPAMVIRHRIQGC